VSLGDTARELCVKLIIGPAFTLYAWLTLDHIAMIAGIFSSLIVGGHSLWQWHNNIKDRRARLAAEALK